ncbi:hypothetical protein [Bacillus gobiensis]|uniref:hypothetical protein n=1 Tax=Bacillus gobiensis TaxID=1441095 RepID=UPI003D20E424
MDILPQRDLIQDSLGNYYEIVQKQGNKMIIVNFVHKKTFNFLARESFLESVDRSYDHTVYVGQFFVDMLKGHIERIKIGKVPGNIYKLEDVLQEYEVYNNPLYEKEANSK